MLGPIITGTVWGAIATVIALSVGGPLVPSLMFGAAIGFGFGWLYVAQGSGA